MMKIETPLWVNKLLAKVRKKGLTEPPPGKPDVRNMDVHHLTKDIGPLQQYSGIDQKDFKASYQALYETANRLLQASGLALDLADQPRIAGYMMQELNGKPYQFACDVSNQNSTETALKFAVFVACVIDHIVACTFQHDRWDNKMKSIYPPTHPTGDQPVAPPESVKLLLLTRLVSPLALKWLGNNPVVFDELIAFLDCQRPTRITSLIQNAQQTLALNRMPQANLGVVRKGTTFDNAGLSFLAWIRAELKAEKISVNCVDSLVHRVDNKVYLITSLAFTEYAKISKIPVKNIGRSLVALGLHELNNTLDQFSIQVGKNHMYAAMVFSAKIFWSRPPSPSTLISVLKSPSPSPSPEQTTINDETTDVPERVCDSCGRQYD